jgi:hypothetical protein
VRDVPSAPLFLVVWLTIIGFNVFVLYWVVRLIMAAVEYLQTH